MEVTYGHSSFQSSLSDDIAKSADTSVNSNPFITDFSDDSRFDQLKVKSDVAIVQGMQIIIDNKNITELFRTLILFCGEQYVTIAASPDLSNGYLKSFRMHGTDATYSLTDKVVIDLDELFGSEEDTGYRDSF